MPADAARKLNDSYAQQKPSISLFALTLGLSKPPREFGLAGYSTQLLPPWMTRLDDYAQGGGADGGRAGGPDAAFCHRRLRGHRFRRARSALCAFDLRAGPAVELGRFGSGLLSRQTRALAGCDRPLSRSDFIRGSQARSPRRRSIPRSRCGNISMRRAARSMDSHRCRMRPLVRRERQCRESISLRPMPDSADTPGLSSRPAPAPT